MAQNRDPLVEFETPDGHAVYVRKSEVLSIRPHGTRPTECSWIEVKTGPELCVALTTRGVNTRIGD